MPLASSGLRALRGHQAHTLGTPSRSLHTPAITPRPARPTTTSVQVLFKQARNFLSTVVGHLAAPGTFAPPTHIANSSRSLLEHAHRFPSIQQRLPPATRFALARPLGAPSLPRAPAVPRSIFHVGLGTARNFSSARPLFDNLAQNVPVAGRAFWEADWDMRLQKEKAHARMQKYTKKQQQKARKALLQPVRAARPAAAAETESAAEAETRAELDRYFPAPAAAAVTTYLLIPLAPTPTARLPLAAAPSVHAPRHPLLPLPALAALHDAHGTHALRVSTVFARLDAARVFDAPGVATAAYGGAGGLCTVLEVRFAGWSAARVRGVLGEAGTGWCVLEEVREDEHSDVSSEIGVDDALSEASFTTGVASPLEASIDPSASFILPTLDFSASFAQETDSWARTAAPPMATPGLADLEFHNAWVAAERDSDGSDSLSELSDSDIDAEGSVWGSSLAPSRRPSFGSVASQDGWTTLGFSSSFAGRVQQDTMFEEPREIMF